MIAYALATHSSDVARCWATQWVMFSSMTLSQKLGALRRFAADPHFGVREMAWMAVRDEVAGAVDEAVEGRPEPLRAELGGELVERCEQDLS